MKKSDEYIHVLSIRSIPLDEFLELFKTKQLKDYTVSVIGNTIIEFNGVCVSVSEKADIKSPIVPDNDNFIYCKRLNVFLNNDEAIDYIITLLRDYKVTNLINNINERI